MKEIKIIESTLLSIWETVLGLQNIDINESIFTLGGSSIQGMQILQLINKEFDSNLGITDLFNNLTVSQLAKRIVDKGSAN